MNFLSCTHSDYTSFILLFPAMKEVSLIHGNKSGSAVLCFMLSEMSLIHLLWDLQVASSLLVLVPWGEHWLELPSLVCDNLWNLWSRWWTVVAGGVKIRLSRVILLISNCWPGSAWLKGSMFMESWLGTPELVKGYEIISKWDTYQPILCLVILPSLRHLSPFLVVCLFSVM